MIHLGTNNLYDDKETGEVAFENTKRLIETINSRLPETKNYYFAIEPRVNAIGGYLPFDQASFDKIYYVNDNMKTFSNENNYMAYLDVASKCYVEGIKVDESFFRDGVHPKLSNYQFYLDALKEAGLELKVNENAVNTIDFDIEKSPSILSTNVSIKKEREYLVNNYSVKGKFKVTETGENSHIQFSLDDTSFRNRFLLWDNDSNGSLIPGYALDGNHMENQGDANVVKDVEFSFEVVTTTKHSYFYINGNLEFVFLNVYAEEFMIGAENTAVSFYDIECILQSDEGWQNILSREELVTYENSSELTTKAVVI